MNTQKDTLGTTIDVAELEKHAKEIGLPAKFFNDVLGLSNSAVSYWKTKSNGRIPKQYHKKLIDTIESLHHIKNGKSKLVPEKGDPETERRLDNIYALLESTKVLLERRKEDPMVRSAHQLVISALEILERIRGEV